jgi:hypothetical protein
VLSAVHQASDREQGQGLLQAGRVGACSQTTLGPLVAEGSGDKGILRPGKLEYTVTQATCASTSRQAGRE